MLIKNTSVHDSRVYSITFVIMTLDVLNGRIQMFMQHLLVPQVSISEQKNPQAALLNYVEAVVK